MRGETIALSSRHHLVCSHSRLQARRAVAEADDFNAIMTRGPICLRYHGRVSVFELKEDHFPNGHVICSDGAVNAPKRTMPIVRTINAIPDTSYQLIGPSLR